VASARQAMRVLGALVHVPGSRNRASLFVKPRHEMGKGRRSVILSAGYGVPLNVALGIVVANAVQMSAELFRHGFVIVLATSSVQTSRQLTCTHTMSTSQEGKLFEVKVEL